MSVDGVNSNTSVNSNFDLSTNGLTNINLIFAQLQMELSETNKDAALDKINGIKEAQEESKAITDSINALRNLKTNYDFDAYGPLPSSDKVEGEINQAEGALEELNTVKNADPNNTGLYTIDQNVQDYMNSLGDYSGYEDIRRGGCDNKHYAYEMDGCINAVEARLDGLNSYQAVLDNDAQYGFLSEACIDLSDGISSADEIDSMIASLESLQEEVGSNIQQEMVFVQDYMGQYNSYTQGASSSISKASDTLTSVASGR